MTLKCNILTSYSLPSRKASGPNALNTVCVTRKNSGFTLVELLMVIAIISILSTLAIPSYNNYRDKTKNGRAMGEIRMLSTEISGYILDKGVQPPDGQPGLIAIGRGGFKDPWGNDYEYKFTPAQQDKAGFKELNTDYDLYSKGKDGQSFAASPNPVNLDDIARLNNGMFVGLR
jgi:general secretion pathway protein G